MLPAIPRRRQIVGQRRKPLAGNYVSLVARLYRTAERQACDIEQRLARPSAASPERERDVRMLASLVQSVRTLSTMAPEGAGGKSSPDDEPRDIDAFRNELARRIHALIDAQQEEQAAEEGKNPSVMPGPDPGIHDSSPRAEIDHGSPGQAPAMTKKR